MRIWTFLLVNVLAASLCWGGPEERAQQIIKAGWRADVNVDEVDEPGILAGAIARRLLTAERGQDRLLYVVY